MVNAEISLSLGHPAGLALGNYTLIKHTTLSLSKKKRKNTQHINQLACDQQPITAAAAAIRPPWRGVLIASVNCLPSDGD